MNRTVVFFGALFLVIFGSCSTGVRADVLVGHQRDNPAITLPALALTDDGAWRDYDMPSEYYIHQAGVIPIAGDFNGDGLGDLAFYKPGVGSSWQTVPVHFLRPDGSWHTTNKSAPAFVHQDHVVAIPGDFTGDGLTDIAFHQPMANSPWGSVPVLAADGEGGWIVTNRPAPDYVHQEGVVGLAARLDRETRHDLVFHKPVRGSTWRTLPVLLARNDGRWEDHNLAAPDFIHQEGSVAVAGPFGLTIDPPTFDEAPQIIVPQSPQGRRSSNGRAPEQLQSTKSDRAEGLRYHDSVDDLAFYQPGGGWVATPVLSFVDDDFGSEFRWEMRNGTTPGWASQPDIHALPGDYDGDGRMDLAFRRPGVWGSVPVLLSRGGGQWEAVNSGTPGWANQVGTTPVGGDFNGDGRSDIAFRNPGLWGSVPILKADGQGGWIPSNLPTPSWANAPDTHLLRLDGTITGETPQQSSVNRNERIAVMLLSDLGEGFEGDVFFEPLYGFINAGAKAIAESALPSAYRDVIYLEREAATLDDLVRTLDEVTSASGVKAVDLFLSVHGHDEELHLSALEAHSISDVGHAIRRALTVGQRGKLRAVFSTACYGSMQTNGWLRAGFKTASGASGIYADSATTMAHFMAFWTDGTAFDDAIDMVNATLDPIEEIAVSIYPKRYVDSTRIVEGIGPVTIATNPISTSPPDYELKTSHFGGNGGTPFNVACPEGEVAAGLQVNADDVIRGVGIQCVRTKMERGSPAWSGSPRLRGHAGLAGGDIFDCNTNQGIRGFRRLRSGFGVDRLQIECARLHPGNTLGTVIGAVSPSYGGAGGTDRRPTQILKSGAEVRVAIECDVDQPRPVTGIYGRAGASLDALGLVCRADEPGPTAPQVASGPLLSNRPDFTTRTWGGQGGERFSVFCNPGENEVLVGIRARAGSSIDQLQGVCREIDLATGAWLPGSKRLSEVGGTGGEQIIPSPMCPEDHAIMGFGALWTGGFVDGFQLRCAKLLADGRIDTATAQDLPVVGRDLGTTNCGALLCPGACPAVGLVGRADSFIDRIGFWCLQ